MATDQTRGGEDAMSSEQRARVEAIRARRRTPESREAEAVLRDSLDRELAETGSIATTGEQIAMEDVVAFRRFVLDLRKRREDHGLSLDDVASRSGIDKAALSRLESGKHVNPTINTLLRYARAIDEPICWRPSTVATAGTSEASITKTSSPRRGVG
jgi:DNA-binding XRE family transcriptional regulator